MKKNLDLFDYDQTLLIHSFQDAMSNKDFKAFRETIPTKDDILMRYTSTLEDACTEWLNCNNCPGLKECKNKLQGYKLTPRPYNDTIVFSYDECKKKENQDKINEYKDNLDLFDMPSTLKDASFKNIYRDDKARVPIIKYFKEFMDNYNNEVKPKGIYLTGSFGSGKTYLIASLFNEMARRNIKSVLVYYPEFLRNLKASFNTNYNMKFDQLKKSPMLLLDDIGAENCSNWSRDEVLGPILQYRMENNLPTFFTSNLTIDELETSLSITSSGVDKLKARRIVERIKELTIQLELVSKNRRG